MKTEHSRQEAINKGVRQGCPMNNGGVQVSRTKKITTILFADDELIIADSEDKLQIACHNLNEILTLCRPAI
jgi:hypothetical protein